MYREKIIHCDLKPVNQHIKDYIFVFIFKLISNCLISRKIFCYDKKEAVVLKWLILDLDVFKHKEVRLCPLTEMFIELFSFLISLHIYSISILSSTWNNLRHSLYTSYWYVEFWLYSCWIIYWLVSIYRGNHF